MNTMNYQLLGRSGPPRLRPMPRGTMTFGDDRGWGLLRDSLFGGMRDRIKV